MILITTYYTLHNEERNKEIKECLIKNFQNKYIQKIYLLNNNIYNLDFINDKENKIIQHIISNDNNYKLKYNDALNFINTYLKNKICILSNSDIYFDNTLKKINNKLIYNNCFALLRYDIDINRNKKIFTRFDLPRDDSQDCWIFRSPLNIDLKNLDFSFGTLGCDSIFAFYISQSGLKLSNPSLDIISIHLHNSEIRTYHVDICIHGKYCLVKPCYLGEFPELTFMDY